MDARSFITLCLALLTNNRIGLKGLAGENTSAYYKQEY
jgi:hypothetical protein